MKSLAIVCAVLAAGLVNTAKAEDVSKAALNAMGFGNATIMTDAEGLTVRGKGTSASVWGQSRAFFRDYYGSSSASNGYNAGASHHYGSSYAKGASDSFAGRVKEVTKTYGPYTQSRTFSSLIVSGGGASAFAK